MTQHRPPVKGRVYYILNLLMVLMYGMGGILLFFWKMPSLPDLNRYIICIVLLLYSTYRSIILYRKFKRSRA